jgi:type IV pilus assembly protein PilM
MAGKTVGLDIGTHAVRAAEVSFGRGRPTLARFGQIALPVGAVVGGEVVDPGAVAEALRRLWRDVGFSTKSVVVGVANQRVVARTTSIPAMSDAELRTALQYQVQELIPIPLADAVLDHQVVGRLVGEDGQEALQLLVVAAHKEMLAKLLDALSGAGLSASRVDLIPFALVRALHTGGFDLGDEAGRPLAEAIVGVGAGVTNVVVHTDGTPRFVRTLNTGGNAVVERLAGELGVDVDTAEDLKRRADARSSHPGAALAAGAVSSAVESLIEEVRGSLDFHLSQPDAAPLRHVVLTGGASRMPGLAARLEAVLGVPVVLGQPLAALEVGKVGISTDVLLGAQDLLAVPLGLALSGLPTDGGERRITLLPGDIAAARVVQRQLLGAGAGVAAFAAVLMALLLLRGGEVDRAEQAAEAEADRTTVLQAEIASLADVEVLQADLASRTTAVTTLLSGDVAWSRLLQEVTTALPSDVWIESFTGTAGTAEAPGVVTFAAKGSDQTSTARWLLRVAEVEALDDLWVASSTKTPADGTTPESVTLSSTATLTPAARSDRAAEYLEATP